MNSKLLSGFRMKRLSISDKQQNKLLENESDNFDDINMEILLHIEGDSPFIY